MGSTLAAVDVGGTDLRVGITDDPATVGPDLTVGTPAGADDIPGAVIAAIQRLTGEPGAVGVGVAGLVDHRTGTLVWMPHRPGSDVAMADAIRESIGPVPVIVDNDANMAALAEARLGAGRNHRFVLTLTVGTGIGAGLVIDGRLERGRGFLGEVGHTLLDASGPQCRCGLAGCWEAWASGTALDRAAERLAAADPRGRLAGIAADAAEQPSAKHLVEAADAGDDAARGALADVAGAFGIGLANLVSLLDPDIIVVGGGVASALRDRLIAPARDAMIRHLSGAEHRMETPVVLTAFGERAGLVGAALAARGAME